MYGTSSDPPPVPAQPVPDRLESWKEIAAYLKRSVSTVQRWEAEEGLPVHRLQHSKSGSVYALKSELDAWFGSRDTPPDADPPDPPPPSIEIPPASPGNGQPRPAQAGSALEAARRVVVDLTRDSWRGPALMLQRISASHVAVDVVPGSRVRRVARTSMVVLPTIAITAVATWLVMRPSTPAPAPPLMRLEVDVAPAAELNAGGSSSIVGTAGGTNTALRWTRDGRSLVFVGRRDGVQRLYVRSLDRSDAVPIVGTEGAQVPVLSRDGRWIHFWADREIRRVPLEGGPVQAVVRDVPIAPAGLTVSAAGRVIFSAAIPAGEPGTESIWSASFGTAITRVTSKAPGELAHLTPQLIGQDGVLIFTARRAGNARDRVIGQVLQTGARAVLVDDADDGRYESSSGQLLFLRRGQLMAVPLDVASLRTTGEPIAIADGVAQALISGNGVDLTAAGQFDAAPDALAYVRGGPIEFEVRPLVRMDRAGAATALPFEPRTYDTLDLSPDGHRLAVPVQTASDKWLFVADLDRGTLTRLPASGDMLFPRWSHDARWIAFSVMRNGAWTLERQRADGTGTPEPIPVGPGSWWISSWSSDGRYIAAVREGDIWAIDLSGPQPAARQLTDSADVADNSPVFSPDGRWLAFVSTMNGHAEVFLRPFPSDGPTVQVSVGGGKNPLWTKGGRELIFIQPAAGQTRGPRFAAVEIAGDRVGAIRPLFTLPSDWTACAPSACHAVSRDGERFYWLGDAVRPRTVPPITHVEVTLNWTRLLQPPASSR